MIDVFAVGEFEFPYDSYKFPGQSRGERILYVAREAEVMMYFRVLMMVMAGGVLLISGWLVVDWLSKLAGLRVGVVETMRLLVVLLGLMFGIGGSWWVWRLWKRSMFILTNLRLTKFIYATPWNRYSLSLGLDRVVDTGAYKRGYRQAFLGLGTFAARSGAGNREEKYFYVENMYQVEDLASYVNKVLQVYRKDNESLGNFRPFLPFLKGEARKRFMKKYPKFWS